MRELLQQNRAQSTPKSSQLAHSPSHLRGRQPLCHESTCGSSVSQYPHTQDRPQEYGDVSATDPGYTDGHQFQRSMPASMPTVSPNELATQSVYASNHIVTRPPKRKRSGFEIRDEPIADFIDKGLITFECALSYFNT